MKTPEEIKKGLEYGVVNCNDCITWQDECPYVDVCSPCDDDVNSDVPHEMLADALAYIQQLEAERDALMHWAKGRCDTCAYNGDCVKHDPDPEGYAVLWYDDCDIWEWRGVPKEDAK